jgi:hypothetical protein
MRRFHLKRLGAVALLPILATCSQPQARSAAEALTAEQARAEARLVALLIDGTIEAAR